MEIGAIFSLPVIGGVLAALAATALAYRKGWLKLPLSSSEALVVGKLVFIVVAVMLLITIRNSIDLPAGQFIYGRF